MTTERTRRWPGIIVLLLALGGLGWAIVRYVNHVNQPPPVVEEPPPDAKGKKGLPGPPPLPRK